MVGHANIVWYICEQCKEPVMWIHRSGHKFICKECQVKEKEQESAKK